MHCLLPSENDTFNHMGICGAEPQCRIQKAANETGPPEFDTALSANGELGLESAPFDTLHTWIHRLSNMNNFETALAIHELPLTNETNGDVWKT